MVKQENAYTDPLTCFFKQEDAYADALNYFFKQEDAYADAFNCLFLNKKILMLMPSIGFFKKTVDKILEILDSATGVIL